MGSNPILVTIYRGVVKRLSRQAHNLEVTSSNLVSATIIGMWLNLVEHLLWEQVVAGSNPVIPTILFIKEREMFSLKKNFYLFVITLLLFACIGLYAYNLKLRGDIEELKDKNTYYENVINSLGSGELIEYPELYSEEYIEQINVHNCMWAIDMCSE